MTAGGGGLRSPARIRGAAIAAALAAASVAEAAPARIPIPETLKRSAMGCLAEALRLCPEALAARDHGVACILAKRRQLSRECQGLADQALRLLNGQDVHIELRPHKPPRR